MWFKGIRQSDLKILGILGVVVGQFLFLTVSQQPGFPIFAAMELVLAISIFAIASRSKPKPSHKPIAPPSEPKLNPAFALFGLFGFVVLLVRVHTTSTSGWDIGLFFLAVTSIAVSFECPIRFPRLHRLLDCRIGMRDALSLFLRRQMPIQGRSPECVIWVQP